MFENVRLDSLSCRAEIVPGVSLQDHEFDFLKSFDRQVLSDGQRATLEQIDELLMGSSEQLISRALYREFQNIITFVA